MLASSLSYLGFVVINISFVCFVFLNLINKKKFIFTKLWYLILLFLALALYLASLGEDFFVVFALASELPVFFGFFFFFAAKAELAHQNEMNPVMSKKGKIKKIIIATCFFVCIFWFFKTPYNENNQLFYLFSNYQQTLLIAQRSDFFIFYFYFYVNSPILIIILGALITAVTVIIILITYKNQLLHATKLANKSKINAVRTQTHTTQNSQPSTVLFFRI